MALATGGFQISKLTISQILAFLPQQPSLLKEAYFKKEEFGHPLAIGWNKIEFFKDFCRYSGLITSTSANGEYKLTSLGEVIAKYDPNLADLSTWWLIHINLIVDRDTNVYYALFNQLPPAPLTKDELIAETLVALRGGVSETTLKKDTLSILGWLTSSPLAYLGVLVTDGENWMRRNPARLPEPLVVAYAAFHLHRLSKGEAGSSRLSELIKGPESLGNIFNLPEEDLKTLLRQAVDRLPAKTLSISETAGMDVVYFNAQPAWKIAEIYYQRKKSGQAMVV